MSADTYENAKRILRAVFGEEYGDGEIVTNIGVGYAEPSYHDAETVWVLGNWNDRGPSGHYEDVNGSRVWIKPEPTKREALPSRLAQALENIGVECEWLDEWQECQSCYKLVRTEPNSYSWTPAYVWHEDEFLCASCAREEGEDILSSFVNNANNAVTDWATEEFLFSFGYEDWTEDDHYANGWFDGMDDDPKKILAAILKREPSASVIFRISEQSQFYLRFKVYGKVSHERYADVSIVVNGALDKEEVCYDEDAILSLVAELQADCERDEELQAQVFVLWHEHTNDGEECECVQYLTDHHAAYTFNMDEGN